jgi:hypothetical protein
MPTPKCDEETNGEWMSRCIPDVMDELDLDHDQAVGRCAGIWNHN